MNNPLLGPMVIQCSVGAIQSYYLIDILRLNKCTISIDVYPRQHPAPSGSESLFVC